MPRSNAGLTDSAQAVPTPSPELETVHKSVRVPSRSSRNKWTPGGRERTTPATRP